MTTILVTGFGPFPGAPFNPTAALAQSLARRRPALAGITVATHVFPTSYAAVDRELPTLITRFKPDALLMFGLAPRAKLLRVEIRARNTVAMLPDDDAKAPCRHVIASSAPGALALPAPVHRLHAALRAARVPATLSHDAGRYLCNYLAWQSAEAARQTGGPRLVAFIHVPPVARKARRRTGLALADLRRASEGLLMTLAAATRR